MLAMNNIASPLARARHKNDHQVLIAAEHVIQAELSSYNCYNYNTLIGAAVFFRVGAIPTCNALPCVILHELHCKNITIVLTKLGYLSCNSGPCMWFIMSTITSTSEVAF